MERECSFLITIFPEDPTRRRPFTRNRRFQKNGKVREGIFKWRGKKNGKSFDSLSSDRLCFGARQESLKMFLPLPRFLPPSPKGGIEETCFPKEFRFPRVRRKAAPADFHQVLPEMIRTPLHRHAE